MSEDDDWLPDARWLASPNCDDRPADEVIDTVVVHGISLPAGTFGHDMIARLFTNRLPHSSDPSIAAAASARVSAHVLIDRVGHLMQFVGFARRAWHAGRSHFDGRDRVNDFAVGIELEGADHCAYTPAQYCRLVDLCSRLQRCFPRISDQRIVSHALIAPGRKTDPGPAFDWPWFFSSLARTSHR